MRNFGGQCLSVITVLLDKWTRVDVIASSFSALLRWFQQSSATGNLCMSCVVLSSGLLFSFQAAAYLLANARLQNNVWMPCCRKSPNLRPVSWEVAAKNEPDSWHVVCQGIGERMERIISHQRVL